MKYKLNSNSNNKYNSDDLVYDILLSRGIKNPKQYLNLSNKVEIPYNKLKNIDKAIECFMKHAENNDDMYIEPDNDVDGMTSGGALYRYIKKSFPKINIFWGIQEKKGHGVDLKQIPDSVKLVLIPDAGSEQFIEHKYLKEKGISCIVLDHHEVETESKDAIIVNNQISPDYPNKYLSGVGIVYKFLQALDDELWQNYADDFIDLVAIGNIADSMDLRSLETRYYVNKGLKKIRNKFIKALIQKQDYSLKGKLNPIGVAFYIAPLINGLIRFGTEDDKRMMFQAIIDSDEKFIFKPRKKKGETIAPEPREENIYEHMARICGNAKARQDKAKIKESDILSKEIINKSLDKNKIIIHDITDKIEDTMTGLIAMQLVTYFMKPCILFREKENEKDIYSGSIRGLDNSELIDFKAFLNSLKVCDWVKGHPNAAGIQIKKNKVDELISKSNDALKDIDFLKMSIVDYIVPFEELTDDFIITLSGMEDIWGQGLKESYVAITDIKIPTKEIHLIGKKKDNISFEIEDVEFIRLETTTEDYEYLLGEDGGWGDCKVEIKLNVIGKCNINEYKDKRKLQIIIEDWEVTE